ncbi:MAG: ABC transporter ATP-binding protein [Clostridia bacterium]|nr:ABC transporter ATP-binding protein [Clostridia bacterium]
MDINHVKFGYDKKNILITDLSANIGKGKITSIIGPNGCGKSTLLSLLTKLNKPQCGNILIDGQEIGLLKGKAFAKKVASVFQINDGNRDLSVEEFVSYGRVPHKSGFGSLSSDDDAIIAQSLEDTGLANMKDKRLCNMSGGERQRVYIAMALCQQPEILFLDEPTSYLDMYYQLEVLEIVKKINRDKGITVIMVLHDVNQALSYSDDIIVMKDGAIVTSGAANDIVNEKLIADVYGVECRRLNVYEGLDYFLPIKTLN